MATIKKSYGAWQTMTITNLGIAPSLTAAWQSDRVDNKTTLKALDFEILVKLAAVNTAPANQKAIYVCAVPWMNDDSTNWYPADAGYATLPTGAEGTITIGDVTGVTNLKCLGIINNIVQNMVTSRVFNLSDIFGLTMPDGWSLILVNYTGETLTPTGSIIAYRPIYETVE